MYSYSLTLNILVMQAGMKCRASVLSYLGYSGYAGMECRTCVLSHRGYYYSCYADMECITSVLSHLEYSGYAGRHGVQSNCRYSLTLGILVMQAWSAE